LIIFTPASYREGKLGSLDDYPGMTCGAWRMRPESTGYVRIRSSVIRDLYLLQVKTPAESHGEWE
jgi:choline dehydrogenase